MKKILISVSIIAGVAAIVIGATTAYFSDTETNVGNTLSAGTIDIDIDGQNPWNREGYNLGDLKPSETGYINFRINNVGQNPVNIFKTLKNIVGNGGATQTYACGDPIGGDVSSEPECEAEKDLEQREDDIQKVIIYDLSVEVWKGESKIWWQTIYSDAENKSIVAVYGPGGGDSVNLGMIPVGGYMLVTQSYHLSGDADNKYQGDGLTFDIEIRGDQLNQEGGATVTLEDKDGDPDWNIIQGGAQGVLTYQTKGPKFDYSFTASGLEDGNYQLIYYPDPWNSSKQVVLIGNVMTASGGSIDVGNSVELSMDLPNSYPGFDDNYPDGAKVWLVPTGSLSGNILSWTNTDKFLFETALINYDDTDL